CPDINSSVFPFNDTSLNDSTETDVFNNIENEPINYAIPKGRKIAHLNTNGLKSKYAELRSFLIETNDMIACALSETKLQSQDYQKMFEIPGYNFIRKDRYESRTNCDQNVFGEGVGIYINANFDYHVCDDFAESSNVEFILVNIKKQFMKPIIVGVIYVPPNQVNDESFKFLENLFFYV
ncbi:hypothetical protein, partial [Staphylococcus aureus]